ncbi:Transcription factor GTE1 [Bienertia sinuspersici]
MEPDPVSKVPANMEGEQNAANVEGERNVANVEEEPNVANVEGERNVANVEEEPNVANAEGERNDANVEEQPNTATVEGERNDANVDGEQNDAELERILDRVNKLSDHVAQLARKVKEIEQFYQISQNKQFKLYKRISLKDKKRQVMSSQNQQSCKSASERMQELISKLGTMLDKSAIGIPRDFNAIRKQMEAKDGNGYKNVRDIYHDVRSILKDCLDHNDVKSNAHVTAKALLEKFLDKWLVLLPEIIQEEERIIEEDGRKKAFYAQLAKDVSNELHRADMALNNIREQTLQKCRRMSTLEKTEIARALKKLSIDDLMRALEIIAEGNSDFQITGDVLELDLTAQSDSTLWRLKNFIAKTFEAQGKQTSSGGDQNAAVNPFKPNKSILKRKKETPDGYGKPPKRARGST